MNYQRHPRRPQLVGDMQHRTTVTQRPASPGAAAQKHAQWLAKAEAARRDGDAIQMELCLQYADHWYRVVRGQE